MAAAQALAYSAAGAPRWEREERHQWEWREHHQSGRAALWCAERVVQQRAVQAGQPCAEQPARPSSPASAEQEVN